MLEGIVSEYLELLGTSSAVYESTGDYAVGIFSSGWCRRLDAASRQLCDTADNRVALGCGKWLCHEACWTQASKPSIETGAPTDVECAGGLRLYAVPIRAGNGEVVGSINVGYGDPPVSVEKLAELADKFRIDAGELRDLAESYTPRSAATVEIVKRRLHTAARLLGEIVDRRRAELELRKSEERYRRLFESQLNGFAYCELLTRDGTPVDWIYLAVNPAFERLTGLHGVCGKRVSEVIPGIHDSNPELLETYSRVTMTGSSERFESYVSQLDIWFDVAVYRSEVGRFVAVFDNITERKRIQARLAAREALLTSLLQSSSDSIFSVDQEYRYTSFNTTHAAVMKALYGQQIELGRSLLEYQRETTDHVQAKRNLDRALGGEQFTESGYSGEEAHSRSFFEVTHNPVRDAAGQVVGASVFARDTTARNRTEQTLRESEERFRRFFDDAPVGKVMTAPDGKLLRVNRAFCVLVGRTAQELASVKWAEITHPDDVAESRECVRLLLAGERDTYQMEKRYQTGDGRSVWTLVTTRLQRDDAGRPLYFLTLVVDIDERRRLQEALRASERRFRSFFELTADLVCIADIHGCFLEVNSAWEKTLGYSMEELKSRPFLDFVHPDDRASTLEVVQEKLARGESVLHFENRYLRKDGSAVWLEWTSQPSVAEGRTFAIARDVTERKLTEQKIHELNRSLDQRVLERTAQLQAANKELEAFSYSVSHDLRAPLRAVDGYARMLAEDFSEKLGPQGQRQIGVICSEARRMGRLIDDLLAFSRMNRRDLRTADVDMTALARTVFDECRC